MTGRSTLHVRRSRSARRDLGDAIGAGAVARAASADDAAERVRRPRNALVVGGDDDRVDAASFRRAPVDVFDHGRPAISASGFPGSRVEA